MVAQRGRREPLRSVLWVVAAAVLVLTGGCTTTARPEADRSPERPSVQVEPESSRLVEPISVTVTGLEPREVYTLRLRSTDSSGIRWVSSARFRSTEKGRLALDHAKALGGSYHGVDGMGLVESLQPHDSVTAAAYFWSGQPQRFWVEVIRQGKDVTSAVFRRQVGPGVQRTQQTVSGEGFDGIFYRDRTQGTDTARPAVLAFGGSEGGNSMVLPGMALAASGYPTLTIAYFDAPGLPEHLVKIPLEYFATALRWLSQQPGVDPDRIYILGVSRGSEAAELVALHYPELVYGVILGAPSGVVQEGLTGGTGPSSHPAGVSAWSFQGKPIPYASSFNEPHPTQVPEAVIPVEDISGPMFLFCGGHDRIWDSCPFSHAIIARLEQHNVPSKRVLAKYPQAGHGVGALVPYEPISTAHVGARSGAQRWSNHEARADAWPRLMNFLHATSVSRGGN